jgi:hypothetical protein
MAIPDDEIRVVPGFEEADTVVVTENGSGCGDYRREREVRSQPEVVCLLSFVEQVARVKNWVVTLSLAYQPMDGGTGGMGIPSCQPSGRRP